MELRSQLINDIELLPDEAVKAINVLVQQFIVLAAKTEPTARPVYGSGRGQMWIADDFDTPLEELREYME
ncbi:MAG: DUF2281 domain-containing protein [Lachnospiraceae bacterium]|nr:DUF2281 domain-containing protein [Lachnospiraceae bacterium]